MATLLHSVPLAECRQQLYSRLPASQQKHVTIDANSNFCLGSLNQTACYVSCPPFSSLPFFLSLAPFSCKSLGRFRQCGLWTFSQQNCPRVRIDLLGFKFMWPWNPKCFHQTLSLSHTDSQHYRFWSLAPLDCLLSFTLSYNKDHVTKMRIRTYWNK